MPEWISGLLVKAINNEPLVKIMITLVGWVFLMLIIPASFTASIHQKSNIPFLGEIFMFALSFIIVEVAYRILNKHRVRKSEQVKKQGLIDEKNQLHLDALNTIDNLDEREKEELRMFFELGLNSLYLTASDPSVISLSRKKIITCLHDRKRVDGQLQLLYQISDKYAVAAKEYFKDTPTKH